MIPILFICALGCASSLVLKRWTTNKWKRVLWGAGIATLVWVGGVYIYLWIKAPGEMGAPALKPILQTYLIAFMSAACVIWSTGAIAVDTSEGVE